MISATISFEGGGEAFVRDSLHSLQVQVALDEITEGITNRLMLLNPEHWAIIRHLLLLDSHLQCYFTDASSPLINFIIIEVNIISRTRSHLPSSNAAECHATKQ